MENAEEILQCLDEFTKLRPKEIPPELEYYLSFVARTGDPVYQWPLIKCLFREKLINVITEFYEACPSIEIPPCPNVDLFNYEAMKGFILEKLDTFAAAPFTVQRICELLTSPRKEYNRIDKYMRALEKNILVVSTREPGNRKTENGESIVNGLESEHDEPQLNSDINVEVDLDETKTVWHKNVSNIIYTTTESLQIQASLISESKTSATSADSVITSRQLNYIPCTSAMIVEPSTLPPTTTTTTATTAAAAATTVLNEQNSDSVSSNNETVFNLNGAAASGVSKDEHIFVTEAETIANIPEIPEVPEVPDSCEDMETTQIICAETEPITPPENENETETETETEIIPTADSVSECEEKKEDEIVSSTEDDTTNEAEISSSSEQTEIETNEVDAEVTASSVDAGPLEKKEEDEEVSSAAVVIIGPEDMQVEDISPEPEPTPPIVTVTAPKKDTETEIEKVEDVVEVEVEIENENEKKDTEEATDEKQN